MEVDLENNFLGNGFVPIYRKIRNEIFYQNSEYTHLWLHILLCCNHEKGFFNGVEVKSGQFLTGRKALSKDTGINESKIERILNYLEEKEYIEQQKTTKHRVITVLSWDKYNKSEQQVNNKRTTSEQQVNTNNKDNNNDNEKKIPTYEEFEKYALEKDALLVKRDLKLKYDSWIVNDWKTGKNTKITNWKTTLLNTIPQLAKETIISSNQRSSLL